MGREAFQEATLLEGNHILVKFRNRQGSGWEEALLSESVLMGVGSVDARNKENFSQYSSALGLCFMVDHSSL